jgi:endonuclease I
MKLSLALSFFAVVQVQVLVSAQEPPFDDCSIETYYQNMPANVTQWTRTMVAELIQSTHRNVPVYTNPNFPGTNDIWQALTDLDVGAEDDTVHLVYSNIDIPAIPFGTRSWVKEHLWANSRGIGNSGPDYRDIHAMRPVDSDVVFVRDELWYGECDILEKDGACSSPAEGAAEDTCQCNRVFMPPADSRGIIARSLMYMDLKYDGTEEDTLDLRLTDCPFNADTDMGYLSQMMTWSDEYSVTAAETTRNTMACTDWQGNRNPFVDFPQLAEILYPPANPLPEAGRLIYEICEDIPTSAPTFDPNDCETINPGELYIFFMNSDNPDNLSIFVFVDLPEDLELYVTDDAWNGLDFQTQEGAYKVRAYCMNRRVVYYIVIALVLLALLLVDSCPFHQTTPISHTVSPLFLYSLWFPKMASRVDPLLGLVPNWKAPLDRMTG